MTPPVPAPGPPPLELVGPDHHGPVDLDTGTADSQEVAIAVAVARRAGAVTVRTSQPRAARRAASIIDAIVAVRSGGR